MSKRIITARFYSRFRRLSVIQVYAPHYEREEEEKDHFYEELQKTIDGCNRNNIVVVMGDFNAKVGGDTNMGWETRTTTERDSAVILWQIAWSS